MNDFRKRKSAWLHRRSVPMVAVVSLVAVLTTFFSLPVAAVPAQSPVVPDGYQEVAQSQELTLYAHEAGSVAVYQHSSGMWWESRLSDQQIQDAELNKNWDRNARSLLCLSYAQNNTAGSKDFGIIGSADTSVKTTLTIQAQTARFSFYFARQDICVGVEISLHQDTMMVTIPEMSVKEGTQAQIMALEIMPFFGSAVDGTDGYAFVPDGCGALVRFNNPDHAADAAGTFSWPIYSSRTPDINRLLNDDDSGSVQVLVPVFGVRKADSAFTAILLEGEEEASVNLYPCGVVPFYRVMPRFHYRYTYSLSGSKITLNNDAPVDVRISRERITGNRSLQYTFTSGADSDYNGMARTYKAYLEENGLLNKTNLSNAAFPLQLELVMGTTEQRMLFNKYIPMTTYAQAQDMVSALHSGGVGKVDCLLTGWYKDGMGSNATRYKPERKLGGTDGLLALNETLVQVGDTMTLQTDPLLIRDASLSDSLVRRLAARGENQLVMSSAGEDTFLYSVRKLKERFLTLLNPLRKLSLKQTGIQVDHIGKVLYGDYTRKWTLLRKDSLQTYQEVFAEGKKDGLLTVTGGNAYTFASADRITDIPVTTSGATILDEAVPFLQLVLHGNIGYSSMPGNLFNDKTADYLKWIEYGCLPYYRLTYAAAANMRYTDYNMLYSSQFSQWSSNVIAVCTEMQQAFGDTVAVAMQSHQKVANAVYCTRYNNGVAVYVNYNDTVYTLSGSVSVPAGGYLVVPDVGGGNE